MKYVILGDLLTEVQPNLNFGEAVLGQDWKGVGVI